MSSDLYERHSTPVDLGFPDEWYGISSAEHFWFQWRMRALASCLRALPLPTNLPLRALEVGCGTGLLRRQIETSTAWIVDGADLNPAALEQNVGGRGRTLLYNIQEASPEFTLAYDVVILFDVLEHIDDTESFLRAAFLHLRPGGWMLVNVPALDWLYSNYDRSVGHLRRYSKRSLEDEFTSRQFGKVELIRYWGLLLVPLAIARRVVLAFLTDRKAIVKTGFRPPNRITERILLGMMAIEGALPSVQPLGTSVLAAVRSPPPG